MRGAILHSHSFNDTSPRNLPLCYLLGSMAQCTVYVGNWKHALKSVQLHWKVEEPKRFSHIQFKCWAKSLRAVVIVLRVLIYPHLFGRKGVGEFRLLQLLHRQESRCLVVGEILLADGHVICACCIPWQAACEHACEPGFDLPPTRSWSCG